MRVLRAGSGECLDDFLVLFRSGEYALLGGDAGRVFRSRRVGDGDRAVRVRWWLCSGDGVRSLRVRCLGVGDGERRVCLRLGDGERG